MDTNGLIKKLGLYKFDQIGLINTDPHSWELTTLATVDYQQEAHQTYQVLFIHVYSTQGMKEALLKLWDKQEIKEGGICYLVYPKLNNPYYQGIHRDEIFPALNVEDALGYLPGTSYKFNKMVSLNHVFTIIGIKNERPNKRKYNKPSGRVADYETFIPEIEKFLERYPTELEHFVNLTPGRKRQWARHIFSAKTQETRQKRFKQLLEEI